MQSAYSLSTHFRLPFIYLIMVFLFLFKLSYLPAQQIVELNSGWYCINKSEITQSGELLTLADGIHIDKWIPAVVPGTVLTSLLENNIIPDPFYGMNNDLIEDIYDTGREHYTYWFYKAFDLDEIGNDEQIFLHFRGVNYGCDVFLNGMRLNRETHYGMFLRQTYNITSVAHAGKNRLAVRVYPPDPVGDPNGGQGGDGTIGKNVMHQYVAGWDWIQPIRDRNTGIWDKVLLEKTGPVNILNTHVVTLVPGKRFPERHQDPCTIRISTELKNAINRTVKGKLVLNIGKYTVTEDVKLRPFEKRRIQFNDINFENPELWWPNGYGEQHLYELNIAFKMGNIVSDEETVLCGIREIRAEWNAETRSRQIRVNGQKIFIKGGNWIISDAMLRFSQQRYDAEIRMHRDMNLNCIRIWGGAITERPEFYEACDRNGILVMQDLWVSGDCNGRWLDPRKKEDQWTRRQYPDDHALFLKSAADQIRMIRNHPSLAFWCGGNELGPSIDILEPLKDSLKVLDGTRWFVEASTSDSMSFNSIGDNGDGPYGIQPINTFFEQRTFPFNSEVGSVGLPDYEGLKRFMPEEAMVVPGTYESEETGETRRRWSKIHPVWRYHKFGGYGDFISKYGEPLDVKEYAFFAQLVNYNQYRAMVEGFSTHMWEWYTGFIIWKTQNPWTAMRGQMYDYYLDPNGGLFGLRKGSKPLHIFYDPVKEQALIANNTFTSFYDLMIRVSVIDAAGKQTLIYQELATIHPTTTKRFASLGRRLSRLDPGERVFLSMKLLQAEDVILDENLYWLPDENGIYTGLQILPEVTLTANAVLEDSVSILLTLLNASPEYPVAFFNRISVVDTRNGLRVLPVFYSENYASVLPGAAKTIKIEGIKPFDPEMHKIQINGWNTGSFNVDIGR